MLFPVYADRLGWFLKNFAEHSLDRVTIDLAQHRKEVETEKVPLTKKLAELEEKEKAVREAEAKVRASVNEARKNELLSMGVGEDCFYGHHDLAGDLEAPFHEYMDTEWPLVIARVKEVVGRIKEREERIQAEQAAARARQELIDTRVARLKEAGWFSVETDHGIAASLSITIGNSTKWEEHLLEEIATWHEDNFQSLVDQGFEELARRQAAKEEAIRQQERYRIEREQADMLEAERLAMEQRVAMDGDMEYVRQSLVVIQNAGTKLKDIAPQVKTAAVRDTIGYAMDTLRQLYIELQKLQA
jgi:hypothetical protein